MPFHDGFNLPADDQHNVEPAWFEVQKQRRVQDNDSSLRDYLTKEIDTLKAFNDRHMDADEAASTITRPISISQVPALEGYSDEVLAVGDLWGVIIAALVEWPSARIPEIFTLLEAVAKVPDKLHKGEAIDDDGERLAWAQFPYFALTWHEMSGADIQPGQICRQYVDPALLALARRTYLKVKDVEAQLVARHVLQLSRSMMQFIIRTLEKEIDRSDEELASDEATGYEQVKLDWHIPAISFMFKYNGREIYDQVVRNGLRDWTQRQMPGGSRKFGNGAERWEFWRTRLAELAGGDASEEVKGAAQACLKSTSLDLHKFES